MELKITLIQSLLHWEDIDANLEQFSQKVDHVTPFTDVIVLPEMFSTGFTMNAEKLAEPMDGKAMRWMAAKSKEHKVAIAGSLIIAEEGKYYNRFIWMEPDGKYQTYDKRHLFSLSKEPKVYSPGTEQLFIQHKGWKICPQVCYDLRFPVWARNTNKYDIYLNVANWPERRSYAWQSLLRARAIENQVYVVGLNRFGEDGNGIYHSGDSAVIDPLGKTITKISDLEDIQTISISKNTLDEIREHFPFLADRDDFTLNI